MDESIQTLTRLKQGLSKPQSLSELWLSAPGLWQEIQWQKIQLRLWLAAQPGIEVDDIKQDDPVYQLSDKQKGEKDLGDIIYDLVSKNPLPTPIAQLLSQLPPKLMATEPMILEAVKAHENMTTMGPVIKVTG